MAYLHLFNKDKHLDKIMYLLQPNFLISDTQLLK